MKYVIKGGEFNNKGAEAMTLIAIYNIIKRDNQAEIFFYDYGYDISMANDLDIIPFRADRVYIKYLAGHNKLHYYMNRIKNAAKKYLKKEWYAKPQEFRNTKRILAEADYFIDISGYYLTTRFNDDHVDFYLSWLEAINRLNPNCKMFLMPQSFGPFNDSFDRNRAYSILSKCSRIYARERSGERDLRGLGLQNVELCYDSVLIEKNYNPSDILRNYKNYISNEPCIDKKSVAIIPNTRLLDAGGKNINALIKLYTRIIDELMDVYTIYLIPHAGEDMMICKDIKYQYSNNEHIQVINQVLYSFAFEEIVKNMDFIVASRYHSIIHAYRGGIPAIILGWSDKYNEVAKSFKQIEYLIDADNIENVIKKVQKMKENYATESAVIKNCLAVIQASYDCYSFLGDANED